jgi:hypothetical protein
VPGAYIIDLCNLPDKISKPLMDLVFAMEPIVYKAHSRRNLPKVYMKLCEALTELEIELPLFLCRITRHQLVEALRPNGGSVSRGGTTNCTSMMNSEQFQTVMKKVARSRKNLLEGISRALECTEAVEYLRMNEPELFTVKAPRSSVASTDVPVDRDGPKVIKFGAWYEEDIMNLDTMLYDVALLLWGRACPNFNRLLKLHETYAQRSRSPLVFGAWQPKLTDRNGNKKFTDVEVQMLHPNRVIRRYTHVTVNGVMFRVARRDIDKKTTHSGVCHDYLDDHGARRIAYGTIQDIISHRLCGHPDSPVAVILQVRWMKVVGFTLGGRVPVVRELPPGHEWNREAGFVFVEHIKTQNIAYWPVDVDNKDGDKVVIARIHQNVHRNIYDETLVDE